MIKTVLLLVFILFLLGMMGCVESTSGNLACPGETELICVRFAMATLLTKNGIDRITPQTTWTNDLSGDIATGDYTSMKYYLYGAESMKEYYQWDSNGTVYQCEDTSCPDPF